MNSFGKRCKKKNCIVEDDILISPFCTFHRPPTLRPEVPDCSICLNKATNQITLTNCKHTFCTDCITNWIIKNPSCPNCRTSITNAEQKNFLVEFIINKKLMFVTIYEYNLRTVFNEDQYNNFFELHTSALTDNQLYNSMDFDYIRNITPEINNCFENVIPRRESVIIDAETAETNGFSEEESYYRFIF